MIRVFNKGILAALACAFVAGCEDVDWNWDTTWWQKPQRVVRPSRPVQKPVAPREPSAEAGEEPRREAAARPAPADSQPALVEEAPRQPADSATAETPVPAPEPPGRAAAVQASPETSLPFHYLYLVSGAEPKEAQPGEHRVALSRAPPRACAAIVEMLHVPMGRSGSESESYLIYENFDQFEAAKAFASLFDETPSATVGSTVGAEAAFKAGIAELLWILDQGAGAEAKTIEGCEAHLAEAVQSSELPAAQRWAAGLLAGRVASEYKYDYKLARSYYRQADGVVAPGGLESMTLQWWTADSFVQEGNNSEARAMHLAIVKVYGENWSKTQVVRRSRSRTEQKSKG